MSAAIIEPFGSGRLDEMDDGTVVLSVPLRRGVIVIGAGGPADVGRIRVSKTRGTITVSRLDGRPLHVDVVGDGPSTTRVLDVPGPVLTLLRSRGRWTVANPAIGAERPCGVKRFADVVGTFAVAKQRRCQHAHSG
ncbi:hypothetical protein H7K45_16130 [Mycobacterium yunnanensis]|uniref:Uncharacterized protein n=1 Tax=Mycobacterium yunnanensis TaxID=368477 RepID=A0A9X2Z1E1_9MYCO|nr:hypothetical protein [Mycobacterium yunnanensis]MCV7422080.1 hypothetical protein [Mycobacterium yunnanensis]